MSSSISSPRPLTAAEIARRRVTPKPVPASSPAATSAASAQAQAGAQSVQPAAEPFNAPLLRLPERPTVRDVRRGLVGAMADPSVNRSTAQQLYQLHEQFLSAERAMVQTILDGVVS